MQVIYANKQLSNLEVVPEIKMCLSNLRELQVNPMETMTAKADTFGMAIDKECDAVLASLQVPLLSE